MLDWPLNMLGFGNWVFRTVERWVLARARVENRKRWLLVGLESIFTFYTEKVELFSYQKFD